MAHANHIDVTDASFQKDVIERSHTEPVVVDFWAPWCGPCRALTPLLEAAVQANGNAVLAKLNTDENPSTSAAFGIRGIPAVKAFRHGEVVEEFVGLQQRRALDEWLGRFASAPASPNGVATEAEAPATEPSLREALGRRPEDVGLRRALGHLLLASGRLDEADDVLAGGGFDRGADGVRARIALLRRDDLSPLARDAVLALGTHADEAGLTGLVTAVRVSEGQVRDLLRRVAVGVFDERGADDPLTERARTELAAALF